MALGEAAKRPLTVPVCERCRRRRQKCDTTELSPCRACLGAGTECLISGPDQHITLPRTYVLNLEQQAEALRQRLQNARAQVRGGFEEPRYSSQELSHDTPGAASETLIDNLFNHARHSESTSHVRSLVQDLGQVSLSALSAPVGGVTHTAALQGLILSVASITGFEGDRRADPVPLPDFSIAQRVSARYIQDILPGFPFSTPSAIMRNLRASYSDSSPYSIFLTATTMATTAVFLSPASTPNAIGLYRLGLANLEQWFAVCPQTDMLQCLEAVIALGQFATIVGDQISDAWGLSGLAVRIAVDLGLHKLCDTDKKQKLFWSAYSLDRRKALVEDLPVAISDRAIEAELPSTSQSLPFQLYRLVSDIHHTRHSSSEAELGIIQMKLEQWNGSYTQTGSLPCRLLQTDYNLALSTLHTKMSFHNHF